ncbi:hypothetical protein RBA41_12940 [Massilia sp. CCM 9210]|nr:hypothetical protein [Massilia sp. CCM 9210]MDQ1814214.1 hypothetical protein [Massilia sp. CCM 9210]
MQRRPWRFKSILFGKRGGQAAEPFALRSIALPETLTDAAVAEMAP